jgi:hypothetical protein
MANDRLTPKGFLDLVPDEARAQALFPSARWPDGPVRESRAVRARRRHVGPPGGAPGVTGIDLNLRPLRGSRCRAHDRKILRRHAQSDNAHAHWR